MVGDEAGEGGRGGSVRAFNCDAAGRWKNSMGRIFAEFDIRMQKRSGSKVRAYRRSFSTGPEKKATRLS